MMTSLGGTKRVARRAGSFRDHLDPMPIIVERHDKSTVASRAIPSFSMTERITRAIDIIHPSTASQVSGPVEEAPT